MEKKSTLILLLFCLGFLSLFGHPESDSDKKAGNLAFDRDTVIVWKGENQGYKSDFVVRLAVWQPKRYFEWENNTTQGTVLLSTNALKESRNYYASKLFDGGVNIKVTNETTLWLSKAVFAELIGASETKMKLDGIEAVLNLVGRDKIETTVNQESVSLPAIHVKDNRGGEWWFLENPENPILLKYKVRTFTQTIKSITTNKKNTLRWIKESKIKAVQ